MAFVRAPSDAVDGTTLPNSAGAVVLRGFLGSAPLPEPVAAWAVVQVVAPVLSRSRAVELSV